MTESEALVIAFEAMDGQVRHSGQPAIVHAVRVRNMVQRMGGTLRQRQIALLHDVLEDCPRDRLGEFADRVDALGLLGPVSTLTHDPGTDYFDYIRRVRGWDEVVLVKVCDIVDNLTDSPSKPNASIREKYARALGMLTGALP